MEVMVKVEQQVAIRPGLARSLNDFTLKFQRYKRTTLFPNWRIVDRKCPDYGGLFIWKG